jgi:multiple sugar transport system substrate-binding protein
MPGRGHAAAFTVLAAFVLLSSACTKAAPAHPPSPAVTGPATLNLYSFPDPSGATAKAVASCNAQSHGAYTISYHRLPAAADAQRQQLAHRLAAHDNTADIMGLDVTWDAQFKTPPTTWDEMISDAEQLASEGKPHYIEIPGARYEGTTAWFNTLITSAGGSILTPDSQHASLGPPAVHALEIMKRLATSAAADPSLPSQMEVGNWRAMENGKAAFELNYPFVYPAMEADNPKMFKHFKWAPYPEVVPGQPARVTVGGIDLAVSAYSPHPQLAFQAALCLRNRQNQLNSAIQGGLPPTLESLYHDPAMFPGYPFHTDILKALKTGSVRPKTPAYQAVSTDISHLVSPPAAINPMATEQQLAGKITRTLRSSG